MYRLKNESEIKNIENRIEQIDIEKRIEQLDESEEEKAKIRIQNENIKNLLARYPNINIKPYLEKLYLSKL